jgi:hypothetical protein
MSSLTTPTIEECSKNTLITILGILRVSNKDMSVPDEQGDMILLLKNISFDEKVSVTVEQLRNILTVIGLPKSGKREVVLNRFDEWRGYKHSSQITHDGVICDMCDTEIMGVRYKCCTCPDFDLCDHCITNNAHARPDHEFATLDQPYAKDQPLPINSLPIGILTQICSTLHLQSGTRSEMVKMIKKLTPEQLTCRTVVELKGILKMIGSSQGGNKDKLLERFNEWREKKPTKTLVNLPCKKPTKEPMDSPHKKSSIPKSLRDTVFSRYCQSYNDAHCYVGCGEKLSPFNFECGHIVPEKNGGETTIDNLRPICGRCNKSMGTKNMFDFIRDCGFIATLIDHAKTDLIDIGDIPPSIVDQKILIPSVNTDIIELLHTTPQPLQSQPLQSQPPQPQPLQSQTEPQPSQSSQLLQPSQSRSEPQPTQSRPEPHPHPPHMRPRPDHPHMQSRPDHSHVGPRPDHPHVRSRPDHSHVGPRPDHSRPRYDPHPTINYISTDTICGDDLRPLEYGLIKQQIRADPDEKIEVLYRTSGEFEKPFNMFDSVLVGISNKRLFKIEKGISYFTSLSNIVSLRHKKMNIFKWDQIIVTTRDNKEVEYGIYYSDTIEYFIKYIRAKLST